MPVATIIAIIQALVTLGPKLPEIISAGETAVGLLQSGNAPTPEQQASIDALLEKAHAEFQS